MEVLEAIGLLKIDFLGLSTLTIMRQACDLIEARHGVKLDPGQSSPIDDREGVCPAGQRQRDRRLPGGVAGHAARADDA